MFTRAASAPVLLITHLVEPGLGMWPSVLSEYGLSFVHRNLHIDELPADLDEVSAVVSLGGQMSVTNLAAFPFLVQELELMRAALIRGTPIFGLCLGAQLLAQAAGGRVTTMSRPYIGWPELTLTALGAADVLFGECQTDLPVIKWHADSVDVPATAAVLATTATPGCAIFRVGESAWGSQMHLEADPAMLFERWLPDPVEVEAMRISALDPETFAAECRHHLPAQMAAMRPVLARFAQYVMRRETPAAALSRDPADRAPSATRVMNG